MNSAHIDPLVGLLEPPIHLMSLEHRLRVIRRRSRSRGNRYANAAWVAGGTAVLVLGLIGLIGVDH
ncbi:MAG TPA: hypothetical protein VG015_09035 [Candidatus Dormibacteraeota bacterium]|nr:hypothetical protein [Candidatus Dormibacteraeota bacterium]